MTALATVTVPAYGRSTIAELGPAVLDLLTGRPPSSELGLPAGLRGVVVLVVDGLGAVQLEEHAHVAPLLAGLPGTIDAVFPTTTVAALASVGTGLPPSQHGMVGYTFALPDHDQPFAPLQWRIGRRGGGFDARDTVPPELFQPRASVFEQALASGVAATVVVPGPFLRSGLTRAVLRGGHRVVADGLDATIDTAVQAVAAHDGPAVAYAHHPTVDHAGHEHGVGSDVWLDAVAAVDATLRRVRRALPPDVAVIVTADHGMLRVEAEERFDLAGVPDLLDGVRVLAGEPRVRTISLEPDTDVDAVVARWRSALGDRAIVARGADAAHLWGPEPTPDALARIGDVVAIARRGTLVHRDVDTRGAWHIGQHGGPSPAERLVPLRVVRST